MLEKLFDVGWSELLIPTHSVLEMVVRGTLMYLGLFVIFRFVVHRQRSAIGISDVLVIVLVADAAQNAFAKEYKSLTEGVVLVLTIVLWDLCIDWLGYHWKAFGRLIEPAPVLLVRDGKLIARNMRSELLSRDEVMAQARQQGIEHLREVKLAYLEPNGDLSFIKQEKKAAGGRKARSKAIP